MLTAANTGSGNDFDDEEAECMMRFRLAVLGMGTVGKSAILHRFLKDEFLDKYRETVEDIHVKLYEVNGTQLQAEIVDTAGKLSFPAMRRFSILNAQAILLVYSITVEESFLEVCDIFDQIKELKTDFRSVPVVVAGNMADCVDQRKVFPQQIDQWLYRTAAECNVAHLEVSAKTGYRIRDVFETFIRLSRLLEVQAATSRLRLLGRPSLKSLNLPGKKKLLNADEGSSREATAGPTRKISLPAPVFRTPTPIRKYSGPRLPRSKSRNRAEVESTECFVQ